MKKFILLSALLIFISTGISIAQLTPASVEGISPKRNITFTDPITNQSVTRTVGLFYGKIYNPNSGPDVCFYSIDVSKAASNCLPNFDYVDDSTGILPSRVCYILYNYYPAATGPGQLSNLANESGAIQAVIWHYMNGLDLNTITSSTVRNRANAIKTNIDANGNNCVVPEVIKIVPDFDPDFFIIETKNDAGTGVAVNGIQLTITEGSLSTYTVNTDASGVSDPVQVIGTGTGTITATADNIILPKGRIFRHINNECPKVVLACPGPGELRVYSDWGALPVELTSFSSSVNNNNVSLNWITASELNNSGFDIERMSVATGEWKVAGNVLGNGTTLNSSEYTFTDKNVTSGRYNYRLKQIDFNGNFEYFNLSNEVEIGTPSKFELSQNYPNPFNPETRIKYELPNDGFVSIKVFDNSGKEVAVLVNDNVSAGYHTINFKASNLSSGIYFYKLETAGFVKVMKMALVK
ncbi:MAG: T9SS type A sorting domain-containing protein [Ignavibacteria bacterium]